MVWGKLSRENFKNTLVYTCVYCSPHIVREVSLVNTEPTVKMQKTNVYWVFSLTWNIYIAPHRQRMKRKKESNDLRV